MPDINLMGEPGFQDIYIAPKPERDKEPEKRNNEKKYKHYVEEILATILGIGILGAVFWYFYAKSHIRSEVIELTPSQYQIENPRKID